MKSTTILSIISFLFTTSLLWVITEAKSSASVEKHLSRSHHLRHNRHVPLERMLADAPAASSVVVHAGSTETDGEDSTINGTACSGCTAPRYEKREARKEQIKKHLMEMLQLSQVPTINATRDIPTIPIQRILNRSGFQSDSPSPTSYRVEPEGEQDKARTEKVYIFAQSPLERFGFANTPYSIAYFDFAEETRQNVLSHAKLHLYLREPEHIDPQIEELTIQVYMIHKEGKPKSKPDVTKSIKARHLNQWHHVPLKRVVEKWFENSDSNYGIHVNCMYNGTNLVVQPSSENTNGNMYVDMETIEGERSRRERRHVKLTCDEHDEEKRCCRYPLKIDFVEFGWDFVIAPKEYQAFYCSGECPFKHLTNYIHTHLVQQTLKANAGPCCYPTQMSSITMVYLNDKKEVLVAKVPGMIADRCGCA